jgi:DNA polymerase III epsilon subunit-like protein
VALSHAPRSSSPRPRLSLRSHLLCLQHCARVFPPVCPSHVNDLASKPSHVASGHNARFDFHFLNAEFARARWQGGLHSGVCTLALARKVLGGASGREGGSYRLGDLVQVGMRVCRLRFDRVTREHTQRLSLNATNSHRAHDDAHATALLLRLLLREAEVTAPLLLEFFSLSTFASGCRTCARGAT